MFNSRITIRTAFSKSIEFSIEWDTNIIVFRRAIQKFREHIATYRVFVTFQNFLHSQSANFNLSSSNSFDESVASRTKRFFNFFSSQSIFVFNFSLFIVYSRSRSLSSIFSIDQSEISLSSVRLTTTISKKSMIISIDNSNITREISAEKIIYSNSIDSFMTDQIDSIFQTIIIIAVIVVVIQKFQHFRQNNQRRDHDISVSNFLIETVANADDEKSILKTFENIDYFDSRRENEKNTKIVVNVDRHVYYKNVFVFIDKLKNFEKKSSDYRVRQFIVECLRENVIIWHKLKLKTIEKNMYRDVSVNQWCKELIRRFKKRDSQIFKNLQIERYSMSNVRNDKTFRIYVQNIMRHFRAIKFNFTYNQLIMTWNNLNFEFKMQIFESTTTTTLVFFFDFLNVKINVWHEIIMIKRFVQYFVNVNVNKRQISKQSNQKRQNDYQQQFDVDDSQFFITIHMLIDRHLITIHININIQRIRIMFIRNIKNFSINSQTFQRQFLSHLFCQLIVNHFNLFSKMRSIRKSKINLFDDKQAKKDKIIEIKKLESLLLMKKMKKRNLSKISMMRKNFTQNKSMKNTMWRTSIWNITILKTRTKFSSTLFCYRWLNRFCFVVVDAERLSHSTIFCTFIFVSNVKFWVSQWNRNFKKSKSILLKASTRFFLRLMLRKKQNRWHRFQSNLSLFAQMLISLQTLILTMIFANEIILKLRFFSRRKRHQTMFV